MTPLIRAHCFTFLPLWKHDELVRDSYGWVRSLAQRTVKANPKPGGFAAEWSRTSSGRIESTLHIPAAFTVYMRVTSDESPRQCVWGRIRHQNYVKSRHQHICQCLADHTQPLPVTSIQRDHDSSTPADLDMCQSETMSKARHDNTWVAPQGISLLTAFCFPNIFHNLNSV